MALTRALAAAGLCAVVAVLALAPAALADVHVPEGQTVSEMQIIGESARVDGTVTGRVIVVDGDLLIGRGGRVTSPVVLGGRIKVQEGGQIRGDVFRFGGRWPSLSGWGVAGLLLVALLVHAALAAMVVSAARLLARHPGLPRVADVATERPLRTVLLGALAGFGVGAVAVLLSVSLIGLIVGAALAGAVLVATAYGVALALAALRDESGAARLAFWVLLCPVVGEALAALAAVVGLGALLRYGAEAARPGVRRSFAPPSG
jgi:hypothetical protein